MKKYQPKNNTEKKLIVCVDKVVADPSSFIDIYNFKEFIGNLEYGSVSDELLNILIDVAMENAPHIAYLLLDYSVNQKLHFQNKG